MQERRKSPRRRTLKAGTIVFNRDGGISCRVRNLSSAGACLEVTSPFGIPDSFTLVIESDHFRQPCRVIWKKSNLIGILFQEQHPKTSPARN